MNRAQEEPFIDRRTLAFTLAVTLFVIGGTAFLIEFIIQPEIKPDIQTRQFSLNESDFPNNTTHHFKIIHDAWTDGRLADFETAIQNVLREFEEELESIVTFELHLYLLRSMYLRNAWSEGASLALNLQGRYNRFPEFVSDILYYRGHFIAKRDGVPQALSAFRESATLGGRYADEATHITKRIERMNRPLW